MDARITRRCSVHVSRGFAVGCRASEISGDMREVPLQLELNKTRLVTIPAVAASLQQKLPHGTSSMRMCRLILPNSGGDCASLSFAAGALSIRVNGLNTGRRIGACWNLTG